MQILAYTIPAFVVLLATWLVMYKLMRNEDARRNFELRKNTLGEITPIRLRGYERLTLLLERITPEHMLLNLDITNMTAQEVHQHLIQTIRLEFDHNVSQQVYVGNEVWQEIVHAKEEMLRFVNTCATQFEPTSPALPYAQMMITTYSTNGETPTQHALLVLKQEAHEILMYS